MSIGKNKISIASTSSSVESPVPSLGYHHNVHGMSWIITGLFVVGDLAGGGIVALPTATVQLDVYFGLFLTFVMTLCVAYTAYILGEAWVILQRKWPIYRSHCRKPYPEMAGRSMGRIMKIIVSLSVDANQFCISVVFLVLSAKNIHDFVQAFFGHSISFCYIVLVLAACLTPLMFLKSPQDFWIPVVLAMITTSCAVVLLIVGSVIDYDSCVVEREFNNKLLVTNYFLGLGTIMFSYGGHAAFPTIQHDMRRPHEFGRSVCLAFTILFIMYTPVCVMGILTYGNSIHSSIINSVQTTGIQQAVNILITAHCILALTIIMNPLNQDIEEICKVPQHFCWQRVAVRTGVMLAAVFIAETVPDFGPLMSIVGGSTMSLTSLIFPCFFYLYLVVIDKRTPEKNTGNNYEIPSFIEVVKRSPKLHLLICTIILLIGTIGGFCATYSGVRDLLTTNFSPPCYVLPFKTNVTTLIDSRTHTNCCGVGQNISVNGNAAEVCSPFLDYYSQF